MFDLLFLFLKTKLPNGIFLLLSNLEKQIDDCDFNSWLRMYSVFFNLLVFCIIFNWVLFPVSSYIAKFGTIKTCCFVFVGVFGLNFCIFISQLFFIKSKKDFILLYYYMLNLLAFNIMLMGIFFMVCFFAGSCRFVEIVLAQYVYRTWYIFPYIFFFIIYMFIMLFFSNQPCFPKLKSNKQYYVMFLLSLKYINILFLSELCVILFLGGWFPPSSLFYSYQLPLYFWFGLKMAFVLFVYLFIYKKYLKYFFSTFAKSGWYLFPKFLLLCVIFVIIVITM